MLVEQRLKGDKGKVLSSDLMIMHWNIYNNMVKIHDTIIINDLHALCGDISLFKRLPC